MLDHISFFLSQLEDLQENHTYQVQCPSYILSYLHPNLYNLRNLHSLPCIYSFNQSSKNLLNNKRPELNALTSYVLECFATSSSCTLINCFFLWLLSNLFLLSLKFTKNGILSIMLCLSVSQLLSLTCLELFSKLKDMIL